MTATTNDSINITKSIDKFNESNLIETKLSKSRSKSDSSLIFQTNQNERNHLEVDKKLVKNRLLHSDSTFCNEIETGNLNGLDKSS